jgi:hypothetical protein
MVSCWSYQIREITVSNLLATASPPDYNAPVNQYDTQFTVTLPSPPLFHPRTPTNHHDFPTILIPEAPTRLATNSPSLPSAASSSSASSPSANSRGAFASPRVGGRGMGQGVNGGNTPPSPRGADNIIWEKTSVERQCGGDTGRMVDLLLAERNTLVSSLPPPPSWYTALTPSPTTFRPHRTLNSGS